MKKENISLIVHIIAAIIFGYIGFLLTIYSPSNWFVLSLMLVSAVVMKLISDKILGEKKDFKFWLGSAGTIYLFLFFTCWIIFYNLLGI